MARQVFYSFHYKNDVSRVMTVRNRWVTHGNQTISGVIDKADFEKIKLKGEEAIKKWIREQMEYTTVTIVLIGSDTLNRPYVKYEIQNSVERGNAILGVHINKIKNLDSETSSKGDVNTQISINGKNYSFKDIANGIYDYVDDNGYENLNNWVEAAIKAKG